MSKQQIGGIVNPSVVGGLIRNRPPTRAEAAGPLIIPELNDMAAIRAQREELRQEELARSQKKS
jgi:hypothetical protein